MLTTVLVANRGEIATRIVRTCAELGIRSVAVFSDADAKSLHVRLADDAVRLPGVTARQTYLDADRILVAAVSSGADAVHPGYGFLSENASFAEAVESAGLTFVGPSAQVIEALGDKMSARTLAAASGVPVVPGIDLPDGDVEGLCRFGDEHGWPLLIKPARGGGGVGMRVVASPRDVAAALDAARAEACAAFGDPTVYAERYLPNPRHIEVQVFGDRYGRIVALGDRDCSVQRRHQKLVEESPAPGLDTGLRDGLVDAALRLARRVGYVGAGTVEFLVQDGRFHFLEMNTRIQVEHPVTEAVFGVDLVREQLLVAGGDPLSFGGDLEPRGHAIECRINAEDPAQGFLPAPGRVERLTVPWRPGVRLDTGYQPGDEVPAHYDSLLAKLIVWGPTREVALHRLHGVLADVEIDGSASTLPALCAIAGHPDFVAGGVSTHWFEEVLAPTLRPGPSGLPDAAPEPEPGVWIAGRFHRLPAAPRTDIPGGPDRPSASPTRNTTRRAADGTTADGATADGATADGATADGTASDGTTADRTASDRAAAWPATPPPGPAPIRAHEIRSPMRATVTAIAVTQGDTVAAGQVLGSVEAMKMEHPLTSPIGGGVLAVWVGVGQLVSTGEVLLVVEPRRPPGTTTVHTTEPEGATNAAP